MYKKLNEEKVSDRIIPNSEDRTKFWNDIWSVRREHNKHTEFLKVSRNQFENVNSKEKAEINQEMVKMQCRKMPNWKASGKDGVKGYWLENLASLHPHIEVQVKSYPSWRKTLLDKITFATTVLWQKDPIKGSVVDYCRPRSCLHFMRKLMTGMLAEKMYSHLERENVVQFEQKECGKGIRGTKGQLLIDKTVLRDCKRRHTYQVIARIDYKNAYDMAFPCCISECLEMFEIVNSVQDILSNSMES